MTPYIVFLLVLPAVCLGVPVLAAPDSENIRTVYLGVFIASFTAEKASEPPVLVIMGWGSREAQQSGLRHGDRLLAIADKSVRERADIAKVLKEHRGGETVVLKVRRADKELEVPLVLTSTAVPMPSLVPGTPPPSAQRLTALPPSMTLSVERVFGWGNVLSAQADGSSLTVLVGPLSEETLKQKTAELYERLQSTDIRSLVVRVEAPSKDQVRQATVGGGGVVTIEPYLADWRSRKPRLAPGTHIPIRLDVEKVEVVAQSTTRPVTGKVLYDLSDSNGLPLLKAGTPVSGKLVQTPPFGHRLVLDSLGEVPVTAESEVLPTREVLVERSTSSSGIINAYASVVTAGQVVGVRLMRELVLP